MNNNINVLMITGVYLPEINGAVLQCNKIIELLNSKINFTVLTGTNDKKIKINDRINDVNIKRIYINKLNFVVYILCILKYIYFLLILLKHNHIIHIHGYSKKNAVVIILSKILNKKIIIKMTSYGYDDPLSIKKHSLLFWKIFQLCDHFIGISPLFYDSYKTAKLSLNKYSHIANGVDITKFKNYSDDEKDKLRLKYKFKSIDKIILFIGHFSIEKQPLLLYEAWKRLSKKNFNTKLILIGRTHNFFEVDSNIYYYIKKNSANLEIANDITFVEQTNEICEYLNLADIFVLPSKREGLPNVLLEAMACSVPCIVSRLPTIADWLIKDQINGFLFNIDDVNELQNKIEYCLNNSNRIKSIGVTARNLIHSDFNIIENSKLHYYLYRKIMSTIN